MKKEKIYIVGSGGFAKEVFFLIKQSKKFVFAGFIDYKPNEKKIKLINDELDLIDEDSFLENKKSENVCIGVGSPELKYKLFKKFKNHKFPNIIHKSFIGDMNNVEMGDGNIVTAGVIFTTNIKIGSFNVFNLNSTVGHDSIIGDFNVFNPCVNISGNSNIGNKNFFGVGSIILEKKTVGNNNTIGASSLLLNDVDSNQIWIGVPSKLLKNK